MTKSTLRQQRFGSSVQYRAICGDDSYKGIWRESEDDAKSDAANHRKQPGNHNHVINIITKRRL